MAAIKKANKKLLLEMAERNNVLVDPTTSIQEIRRSLIAALGQHDNEDSAQQVMTDNTDSDEVSNEGVRNHGEATDKASADSNLSFDQTLTLRKLEMEFEDHRLAREADLEERRLAREADLEERKIERERAFELEKLKLEYESRAAGTARIHPGTQVNGETGFRLNDGYRSVPNFDEAEVEMFFSQFERVAHELKWPQQFWHILVQSRFRGKANQVYNALDGDQVRDYDLLKTQVLRAYQLTNEAYRQKFRNAKKLDSETFSEFVFRKESMFDRWVRTEDIGLDYQKMRELIIMEEVQNCLPVNVRVHLDDQKVNSLKDIGSAADRYVLVHKSASSQATQGTKHYDNRNQFSAPPFKKPYPNTNGFRNGQFRRTEAKTSIPATTPHRLSVEAKSFRPKCGYCGMTNHLIGDCFARKRDNEKVVGFVGNRVSPAIPGNMKINKYMSGGRISEGPDPSTPRSVALFRDTGAWQSLITREAVKHPELSETGRSVVIQTVGGEYCTLPLHRFQIQSQFVTGEVLLGVIDRLPMAGTDILLGNDLTDSCCHSSRTKTLEVRNRPEENDSTGDIAVYPACVTTRSMSKGVMRQPVEEIDLMDSCFDRMVEETSHGSNKTEDRLEGDTTSSKKATVEEAELLDSVDKLTGISWDKLSLCSEQKADVTLQYAWDKVVDEKHIEQERECFYVHKGVLMRKCGMEIDQDGSALDVGVKYQVVVPNIYRQELLSLGHESLFAGHLGRRKTLDRVSSDYYWPGMYRDTEKYCQSCHVCQVVGKPNQGIPPAPLKIIPMTGEAFSKVIIDIVGPLPKTSQGNQYLLTIMCANTRFPEAIPLRKVTAAVVTKQLIKYFTMTGLPQEIQSDQGSNFMSKLFQQVMVLLGIHQVRSSAYHPASQGALERFHQNLKSMLRCYCQEHEKDWDQGVPYVLFAARDAKQESLGFSPFELVYGHTPKGPLKLLKASWLDNHQTETMLDYVARIKDRLWQATELARQHLKQAQLTTKVKFDRKAVVREFKPGDKVLLYLPIPKSSLQTKYFGPYTVRRRVSDTGYVIDTPDRGRRVRYCHVNLLKAYTERPLSQPVMTITEVGSDTQQLDLDTADVKLRNSEILTKLDQEFAHLPADEQVELKQLIGDYLTLFPDVPSVTNTLIQDVDVEGASPIKKHAYRMNPQKREYLRKEIQYLLEHNIIEPSHSDWSSPCLLVPKANQTYRVVADLRSVNQLIKADAHPLPRIDDCIDSIGNAKHITKLDLLKGYYQIGLTERAKRILTIVTPDGLYQFRVMPFGLKTAPAAFQRLMNYVLADLPSVSVYLDDVIIASNTWQEHLLTLREVFSRLKQANLTVNLAKCEFGKAQVTFLGHVVGLGQVAPITAKVDDMKKFPPPSNQRAVRRFLGMVGYYRKFCPNFATVAAPITALLRKGHRFQWTQECMDAFQLLKTMLCSSPVLAAPNFDKPFKLAVDASAVGSGAVLFQEDDQGFDHPVSFTSKKFNRHQCNYSTVEKEALGLIQALKHFEIYLKMALHKVMVYTDHNPLTFIHRMKETNQRVLRWSLMLQEYPISIQHIAGKHNVVADTLSRQ